MKYGGCIYIMTNENNTVLYVGVTSDLQVRVWQHKTGYFENSFTKKYNVTKLVYYENFSRIEEAIVREKQLKGGSRAKKISLINSLNSEWRDLYEDVAKW